MKPVEIPEDIAREAAVQLGYMNFNKVINYLEELLKLKYASNKKDWEQYAESYTTDSSGKIKEWRK